MSDAPLNLGTLDVRKGAEKPAVLQLEHPITGEPLPGWTISLYSADSDICKSIQRKIGNRKLKEALGKQSRVKMTVEVAEQDTYELLAAVTHSWAGLMGADNNPLEFSCEAAVALYRDHSWVREQASAFINDRANFLGNS